MLMAVLFILSESRCLSGDKKLFRIILFQSIFKFLSRIMYCVFRETVQTDLLLVGKVFGKVINKNKKVLIAALRIIEV